MIKNIIKLKLNIGIKIYYEKKYQKQKKIQMQLKITQQQISRNQNQYLVQPNNLEYCNKIKLKRHIC